jgi:hypothetical protein
MLFPQMLLFSNCQRLEITQAIGSFSIACVISIQFITALGVQGGDFNARPLSGSFPPIEGLNLFEPDIPFVGVSGVQKAVAWISPLLTLIAFTTLIGGRLFDDEELPEKGRAQSSTPESGTALIHPTRRTIQEDTISKSPVTKALILFFLALAAIGNVFVLSFITASGNATAISFGQFGVLPNIAILFKSIDSQIKLNKASGGK